MRFSSGCITAALALVGAAAPVSAQAFEGRIAFKVSDDRGSTREMEYQVRDSKVRFEMPGRGGQSMAMVMDPANQKMLVLMSGQKMYMERSIAPTTAAAHAAQGKASVTATGRKETIAGHSCEHFLITDDKGGQFDACIAHGLGTFLQPPSGNPMAGGASAAGDWSSKIGKDGFPLKVTKGGTTIMEVTKIEKASLDPSLFSPPSDWKKFEMPNMPGMPGGRPPQE